MKRKNYLIILFGLALLLAACGGAAPIAEVDDIAIEDTAVVTAEEKVTEPGANIVTTPHNTVVSGASLLAEEQSLISLYETVNPAVVSIQVSFDIGGGLDSEDLPENHPDIPDSPFDGFPDFDPFARPQQSQGSGFVYDTNGHIITNNHVVADAAEITVIFYDGSEAEAVLVGTDPDSDLAVVRVDDVDASLLQPVPIGDSDALKVGQFVAAIGNPFGLANSMTTGIVSGLGRMLPAGSATPGGTRFNIPAIIQTDAAINPGNSGGPLLNMAGEVIGVNTAIATNSGAFAGVGYAVPAEAIGRVVPELIANGRVQNPWLGIMGGTLDGESAAAMDLDATQRGVLISAVLDDSPAAAAGLRGGDDELVSDGLTATIGGDIIVAIDGVPILEFDDLLTYIVQETRVGQTVTLDILRDGAQEQVDVTLAARPVSN